MIECEVGGKTERFSPEQISAMVLQQLKADAEAYLGEKITEAIQKEIGFESNISVTFSELKIESYYGWRDLNFKGNFVINDVDIKNLIKNNKGEK